MTLVDSVWHGFIVVGLLEDLIIFITTTAAATTTTTSIIVIVYVHAVM